MHLQSHSGGRLPGKHDCGGNLIGKKGGAKRGGLDGFGEGFPRAPLLTQPPHSLSGDGRLWRRVDSAMRDVVRMCEITFAAAETGQIHTSHTQLLSGIFFVCGKRDPRQQHLTPATLPFLFSDRFLPSRATSSTRARTHLPQLKLGRYIPHILSYFQVFFCVRHT